MSTLIREVRVRPAFDKRSADPKKNYGVHGAELGFFLRGQEGAVQFIIYTSWNLPNVQAERDAEPLHPSLPYFLHKPTPADIGYHSKVPRYEGQKTMGDKCEFTDNGPCYYDGSSLNAEEGFTILVAEGHEAMWKWMEGYYSDWLLKAKLS